VLALLLRLPFVFTGLSTDEGGYAYVAREWSRGRQLYVSAWLDRPQGLLLTYRFLLWINGTGWTIRVGMMLAGAIISVCLGVVGWQLAGRRAGVLAAFGYAIIGVAPHLEGVTLNGELLAAVPSAMSIAAAVLWWRRRSARWLLAAGVLAGVSLTMKQSGIDGLLVGLAITLSTPGARIRRTLGFLGAFAVPVAACVVHGATIGLGAYWNALAGYQFHAMGGAASNGDTRWTDFTRYLGGVAIDVAIVLVIACFGFRALSRSGRLITATWLLAGVIGVNLGGSYWPHYYMQPLVPLVLLAAVAVAAARPRSLRVAGAAILVLPTVIWLVALVFMSPHHRQKTIPYYAMAVRDRHVADAIDAQTTPDQNIYILESQAYVYFLADRPTAYPYLWGMPIQKIPDALPRMRAMLAGPDRPTLVVMDTPDPDAVDPSGGLRRDLTTYYHPDGVVDGMQFLRAN